MGNIDIKIGFHDELQKGKDNYRLPFNQMGLFYIIGFYDATEKPSFTTDAGLINVKLENAVIGFDVVNKKVVDIFESVHEFTLAPTYSS